MRLALVLAAALTLGAAAPALAGKAADAEVAFADARDQDAIRLYGEAIAETTEPAAKAAALFGRGEVYAAGGRADEAIADFTAALAADQDPASRANALFSRAEARTRKRDYEGALADYSECLTLAPGLVGANFGRGRALRALKRDDEAVKAYDAELKINPTSFRALSARADLLGLPQPEDKHRQDYLAARAGH